MHGLLLVTLITGLGQAAPSGEKADSAMNHRGATVMGFDQSRTTHHFRLYADGGAIEVSANDAADVESRDAIRAHLPHIAKMFGGGDFSAPMLVHAQNVPGTAELAKRKDRVRYLYLETTLGGRVDIETTDEKALEALHQFLRFQIRDHQTGDSMEVEKR